MFEKKFCFFFALAFLIIGSSRFHAYAQTGEKHSYYINLNEADGQHVHVITDRTLSLHYFDAYGRWKNIPLQIYDWRRNLVATLSLDKAFGLNSFVVDMDNIYSDWGLNKVYTCRLKDESNQVYELPVKLVAPPEMPNPLVDIIVNPLEVKCDDLSQNVVDFYGKIEGGKPPYTVNWFIVNNDRTKFLYQPREEWIEQPGKTMVVTVDQNPDYYVLLYVKDACGGLGKKAVNLVCHDKRKRINTLFVEDFDMPDTDGLKNK